MWRLCRRNYAEPSKLSRRQFARFRANVLDSFNRSCLFTIHKTCSINGCKAASNSFESFIPPRNSQLMNSTDAQLKNNSTLLLVNSILSTLLCLFVLQKQPFSILFSNLLNQTKISKSSFYNFTVNFG